MPSLTWLNELDKAIACGEAGAILSFNTTDRVYEPDEPERVASLKYFLASRFHQRGFHVGYYSLSEGFRQMRPPGVESQSSPFDSLPGSDHPQHVMTALGRLLQRDERCMVIIDFAEHLAPGGSSQGNSGNQESLALAEILHSWSLDDNIRQSRNFVILLTSNGNLCSLVANEGSYPSLTIDLPVEEIRRGFIDWLQTSSPTSRSGRLHPDISPQDLARLTGGLRLRDIERLFQQAAATGEPISRTDIKEGKRHAISQMCNDLVELVEPTEGFESVAGIRHAKEYFAALKPLWDRGATSIPQGILLAGVPGSGKSFLVKALAKELNCPCLVMRNLREMWVGQSERNLERVLKVAETLAPLIIWTDEVDQNGGGQRSAGNSGDSGVGERMLGRMLEFFGSSERRGRILWVATTNRPDLLDVAIRDRFTLVIPFLHPTATERAQLLPLLARQVGRKIDPAVNCRKLAASPALDLVSVRSLQEVVVWAGTLADIEQSHSKDAVICTSHLERAISEYQSDLSPREQEMIALTALNMTRIASLLPWNGLSGFRREEAEWPRYVDGLIAPGTGALDRLALALRLQELYP